jgi:subtilisin family serine protease
MKRLGRTLLTVALFYFVANGSVAFAEQPLHSKEDHESHLQAGDDRHRAPPINWDTAPLYVHVVTGTSVEISVGYSSSEDIKDVSFWIDPKLARFITVNLQSSRAITRGHNSFDLVVSAPRNARIGVHPGTLHIRSGKRTVARPLPISLTVSAPTTSTVPDAVSYPSLDRIVADPATNSFFLIDEALVAFKEGTTDSEKLAIISKYSGIFLGGNRELGLYQVVFPEISDVTALDEQIAQLSTETGVDAATRSWVLTARRTPDSGNDPAWLVPRIDEWNEQDPRGDNSALEYIRLPSAWDISTGSKAIRVGIVDTAFDFQHEDLRGNITDAQNIPFTTGDDHGTAVAGIVGATGNNNVGMTGVMWSASLQLYGAKIPGTEKTILFLQAIAYVSQAIDDGAKIINYSGGIASNQVFVASNNFFWRRLLDKPKSKNVLFVFASGNETGRDDRLSSPSSLAAEYDNVISVTSIDFDWGPKIPINRLNGNGGNVSVAAPGVVFSTLPGNRYLLSEGTSFATPLVTGLAGLIWSVNPALAPKEIKWLIVEGARHSGKQVPGQSFYVIDAYESLRLALEPPIPPPPCSPPPSNGTLLSRLNGQAVYDPDRNITWLANANLAASNTFGVSGVRIQYGGIMSWSTAQNWIAAMNAANYLGYSDWRLPTSDTCSGYNCTGSEMGHLFYNKLGGVAGSDIGTTHNANYNLFQNIVSGPYWSGTEYAPDTDFAWIFSFYNGTKFYGGKGSEIYALAVRSGDVTNSACPPVVYQPGNDVGVQDIWTTSTYSYSGAGGGPGGGLNNEQLRVGGWADWYYSLIQFDLTSLPPVASKVELQLYMPQVTGYGTTALYLDRVTQFWDWRIQGTGSDRLRLWWADRPGAVPWIPNALPAPTVGWYTIDITSLYNAWKSGTYPNYGVQLRPVSNSNTWAEFNSSNHPDPSLRPRLVVTP